MHSWGPSGHPGTDRPPARLAVESLTYPPFAASGKWVLCNRYGVVRCAPVWPLGTHIVPNGGFLHHPTPRGHRSPATSP